MKKYRLLLALVVFMYLSNMFAICISEEKSIGIGDVSGWFGEKIESVEKKIEDFGYKASPDNKTGILSNVAWEFTNSSATPYSVVAWFNTEGRDVTRFSLKYDKDAELFGQVRQSLTALLGEPAYQECRCKIQDDGKQARRDGR